MMLAITPSPPTSPAPRQSIGGATLSPVIVRRAVYLNLAQLAATYHIDPTTCSSDSSSAGKSGDNSSGIATSNNFSKVRNIRTSAGYNLCLLVGPIHVVVDKMRVDGSRVRLAEVIVGDETGMVSLRARDSQIDLLQSIGAGAVVLRNCTVELFQNKHLRLAVTKWGKISSWPDNVASTPSPPTQMNTKLNYSLADLSTNTCFILGPPEYSKSTGNSVPPSSHQRQYHPQMRNRSTSYTSPDRWHLLHPIYQNSSYPPSSPWSTTSLEDSAERMSISSRNTTRGGHHPPQQTQQRSNSKQQRGSGRGGFGSSQSSSHRRPYYTRQHRPPYPPQLSFTPQNVYNRTNPNAPQYIFQPPHFFNQTYSPYQQPQQFNCDASQDLSGYYDDCSSRATVNKDNLGFVVPHTSLASEQLSSHSIKSPEEAATAEPTDTHNISNNTLNSSFSSEAYQQLNQQQQQFSPWFIEAAYLIADNVVPANLTMPALVEKDAATSVTGTPGKGQHNFPEFASQQDGQAVWRHHYNQTSLSFQQPYYTPQHPRMLYAPRVNPQLAYSFESGNPTTDEYQEATVEDVSNDFAEPT